MIRGKDNGMYHKKYKLCCDVRKIELSASLDIDRYTLKSMFVCLELASLLGVLQTLFCYIR